MIVVDHALMGVALYLAAPSDDPWLLGATLGGSLLPDLDVVHGRPGTLGYLARHRTYLHSLVGAPLYALAWAGVLALLGASDPWALWGWTLAGVVGHLGIDVLNSFGTMVWFPLDRKRVAWDLVFEFDVAFSAILALAVGLQLAAPRLWGVSAAWVALGFAGVLAGYVALRASSRRAFCVVVGEYARKLATSVEAVSVVPATLWRWKGIVATASAHHVLRRVDGELRPEVRARVPIPDSLRRRPEVRIFERYARHLDVELGEAGTSLRNLIYSPTTYRMDVPADGSPVRISLPKLDPGDY